MRERLTAPKSNSSITRSSPNSVPRDQGWLYGGGGGAWWWCRSGGVMGDQIGRLEERVGYLCVGGIVMRCVWCCE